MNRIRLVNRVEDGRLWPVLVWDAGPGWRMVATTVVGGGIGERAWWLNAMVNKIYHEPDPAAHIVRIATALGLGGTRPASTDPHSTAEVVDRPVDEAVDAVDNSADNPSDPGGPTTDPAVGSGAPVGTATPGVGMLTAADVTRWAWAADGGVEVAATVGLGLPTPAAASVADIAAETRALVGTINILAVIPAPLSDAALVNAVVTATEAKTQALHEAGIRGTGTSSDAVCVACPVFACPASAVAGPGPEPYGGPRSTWGAPLARAVHTAVAIGTARWLAHQPSGAPPPNRP